MVRLIQGIEGMRAIKGPLHLALGVFDGLHIGHQAVIGSVIEAARSQGGTAGILTFDPHPIQVLAPEVAPHRILASLNHKRELLGSLGVDVMVVVPFTVEFAACSAGDFLDILMGSAPVLKTLAMGADWRFGKNREGDVSLLKTFGRQHGIEVIASGAVMLDGERVSSTRIRQAIRDGNMEAAKAMLGRDYSVLGTVIAGRQLGRTLGFPTANLKVYNEQLPADGVWCVEVSLENGERVKGVGNLGVRPTVEGAAAKRMLEIHLLDFDADLYGRDVEVRFLTRVRDEKKFATLDDLQKQIRNDVEACRRIPM
jgi:riboflavin kinase/FMN adenylyltransferase